MPFTERDRFWHSSYRAVWSDPAIRVLQFRDGVGTPIVIVPPQAGHHSYIADYGPDQSLVEAACQAHDGPVYCIEWKSCTPARCKETIEDLVEQLRRAVYVAGNSVHLVGLCQGGWLSTIYTVLYPDTVASLVIAGTPIDTHAGESVLHEVVRLPLSVYETMVTFGQGRMLGQLMLTGWKSSNPYQHYIKRFWDCSAKTRRFYRWYDLTQDLAGTWYLWAIQQLFKENRLGTNQLTVGYQAVDLTSIRCPVTVIAGRKDDITPPVQSLRLLDWVGQGTYHEIDAGHIGVFMGRTGIQQVWTPLFTTMR